MMPGMIMMWAGSVASIPSGWHLCDGTAGTIDLRNKFLVCAGDTYDPGDGGGSLTHDHDFTTDGHTHTIMPDGMWQDGSGTYLKINPATDTGTTDADNHLPPYYALCFIQKL